MTNPEQQVLATLDTVSRDLPASDYLELLQTLKDDLEMRAEAVEGEIEAAKHDIEETAADKDA